ncbi:conjugal transfer protein TraG N-terminal domain-containing protein [Marinobacter sp. P4B1]|uniref:conjugal transfer protein TraG N-terminal domain-containing protein n=1 Tax=Marinobacter sp. P4B1 TaxID=1119533 RepID=UPI00071D0B9C|nr:conjugal transfer protein TraG N-terminal domain-containing protein [Marinobacter sp. P4B1]KRW83634.1 hypothetical protein AQ621_16430 [Marinobacter sp. P4B1]
MDFTIRVLGDISYLAEVIRASSAIMSFADFKTLLAIGFLLGILWIVIQGISSGGSEIKVGNIAVAGLMYALFFGITVDGVRIQQERTVIGGGGAVLAPSRIEIVDDVPIGLAASGAIISGIGSKLSDWFRTEFTRPDANGIDPLFALEMLMRMKDVGFDNSIVNWDPEGLIQGNIDRYFQDCTKVGLSLQDTAGQLPIKKKDILEAGTPDAEYETVWEAIKLNNNLYRTRVIYKDDAEDEVLENLGCAEAHDRISVRLFGDEGLENMKSRIVSATCGSSISGGICPKTDVGSVATDAYNTDAKARFDAVAKAYIRADIDVTKQFMNRIGLGAFDRAAKDGRAVTEGDVFVQAIAGRASSTLVQNQALQSSIFMKTMTPLMAFFEAMMYIAAPFAAFLVTLGIGGISLIGKYLVFATWIQLWKPVAAAIELYIEMAASGAMASLSKYGALDGGALGSISRDAELYSTVTHWLGTGSMLLAATPAITLMLIYGSAVTASSLAGRVDAASNADAGVDTLDGKAEVGGFKGQLTPNAETSIGYQANASDAQGTFDLQSIYSQGMTNSAAKEQSLMEQATERVGQGSEAAIEGVMSYANQVGSATAAGSSTQTLSSVAESASADLVSSNRISSGEQDTTAMAIQLGIAAQAEGGQSTLDQVSDTFKKNGVDTSNWSTAQKATAAAKLSARGDIKGSQTYQEIAQEVNDQSNRQVAAVEEKVQENSSKFEEERSTFNEAYSNNESFKESERAFQQAEKATSRATSLRETRQATQSTANSLGARAKMSMSDFVGSLNDDGTKAAIGDYINQRMADPNRNEAVWDGVDTSTPGIIRAMKQAAAEGDLETVNEIGAMAGLIDPVGVGAGEANVGTSGLVDEVEDATSADVDETYNDMADGIPKPSELKPDERSDFAGRVAAGQEEILNREYDTDVNSPAEQSVEAQIENNNIDRNLLGEDFDKLSTEQKMARVQQVGAQQQGANGTYARDAFKAVEYLTSEEGQKAMDSMANNSLAATAGGAGLGAMIAKRVGSNVAKGALRGGKAGMVAGLAVGGYQAYNDYKDYQTEQMFNEDGFNIATASEMQLQGLNALGDRGDQMRDYLNTTMTSVAGQEFSARMNAESRGEEFDAEAFRETLNPFEQQVYDNFGTLSESSQTQAFRDDLADRTQTYNQLKARSETGLGGFGWGGATQGVAQIDSALTGAGEKYDQFLKDNNINSIETPEQEQAFYEQLNVPERRVYAARAELGEAGYGSQVQNDSFFEWRDNPELVNNYRANNKKLSQNFGEQSPDQERIAGAFVDVPDREGRPSNYVPSIESVGKAGEDFEYQSATSGGVQNRSYSLGDNNRNDPPQTPAQPEAPNTVAETPAQPQGAPAGAAVAGAELQAPSQPGAANSGEKQTRFDEMRSALEVSAPNLLPKGSEVTPDYVQSIDSTLQNLESLYLNSRQQNGDGYSADRFAAETPMNEFEAEVWSQRDNLMDSGFGGAMVANR